MPKVITIANLKGGVTKSTSSINLSVACIQAGLKVAILDLDVEQQACARWADGRDDRGPTVLSPVYTRLQPTIAQLADHDLIIVDCPAHDARITDRAISLADLVIVPCGATVQDVQFLENTIAMCGTHNKPTAVMFARVEPIVRETSQALAFATKAEYPIAPVSMSKAVAYHRAITASMGVGEYEPAGKAASEMRALQEWVSILLGFQNAMKPTKTPSRSIAA